MQFLTNDTFMHQIGWLSRFFSKTQENSALLNTSLIRETDERILIPSVVDQIRENMFGTKNESFPTVYQKIEQLSDAKLIQIDTEFSFKDWAQKRIKNHDITDFITDARKYSEKFIHAVYNCLKFHEEDYSSRPFLPAQLTNSNTITR